MYCIPIRFFAAFLMCVVGFFYTATFDTPASLESYIEEKLDIESSQFEYLYSVYSFPNTIECFFTGVLIDKVFGLKTGSLIFALLVFAGQVVYTCGNLTLLFYLMLIGRFIYGMGAETVLMSMSCFSIIWFEGKELNFVYGALMAIGRLGTSFIFLISSPVYHAFQKAVDQKYVLGFSVFPSLVFAFLIVVIIYYLGYVSKKHGKLNKADDKTNTETINFKQTLTFPLIYWLMTIMESVCNASCLAFISCSQQLLKTKYGLTVDQANTYSSVTILSFAVFSPIIGMLVDRFGYNIYFCLGSMVLNTGSQLILGLTDCTPYVPLIMTGAYFAVINGCGWLLASRVVEPYQLATAYGILQSTENLSLTLQTLLAGFILSKSGAVATCMFFMATAIIGLVCGVLITFIDRRGNNVLNLPGSKLPKNKLDDEPA